MEGEAAQGPATSSGAERHAAIRDELGRTETALAGVEQALTRLDDGTYGSCERCRALLDDEVLAADPLALRCADHR